MAHELITMPEHTDIQLCLLGQGRVPSQLTLSLPLGPGVQKLWA